ncbi:MAG: DUF502 domain-containing protein [Deltaproteobacteria bacterium]|nr:DUF502 domain-containing protein [Deltaproteobacteria bacterium]
MIRRLFVAVRETLRRYFVAGILFFAPIGITIWAIVSIIRWLDNLILPRLLRLLVPGDYTPPPLPILGTLFTLLAIVLIGFIARHLLGGEVIRLWERVLKRVPVASNIYMAVKQLFEAIFSAGSRTQFRRVVLIEYPRKGLYALAFTTGPARGVVQEVTPQTMVNCFLPTTPNPTSGFYLLVPEEELIDVDLTVEEAFKLVMSAGMVTPDAAEPAEPAPEVPEELRGAPPLPGPG